MKKTLFLFLFISVFLFGFGYAAPLVSAHSGHIPNTAPTDEMGEMMNEDDYENMMADTYVPHLSMHENMHEAHQRTLHTPFWGGILQATVIIWLLVGILLAIFLIVKLNKK